MEVFQRGYWADIQNEPHLKELKDILSSAILTPNSSDKLIWKETNDGTFTVKSAWNSLRPHLPKIAFSASIYFIWLERNQRLFEGKSSQKQDILSSILLSTRIRVLHLKPQDNSSDLAIKIASNFNLPPFQKEKPTKFCRWILPYRTHQKLNCDVSLSSDGGSVGGIIRNSAGESLGCYSLCISPAAVHELEIEVVLHGVILAKKLKSKHIWIESDSVHAVRVIKGIQNCPWRKLGTLDSITTALKHFDSWNMSHSWREANKAADILSKFDYHCKGVSILSNFRSPP
ncbi:uncharacterized protein LOC143888136 [Tasmannia lanceolata]|uniref:uncharacterized protein LOC143888136 n=1 Tax=Tasmannia lanceolata TaxID=3420 RepID=UPI004063EE3A